MSIVSLPIGNYKQHFKNSCQTFSMLISPLSPFYTNKTYLLFLPNNISWECFIDSTHSVYRLHAIPCMVALQFICPFFKLVNIWIIHKILSLQTDEWTVLFTTGNAESQRLCRVEILIHVAKLAFQRAYSNSHPHLQCLFLYPMPWCVF